MGTPVSLCATLLNEAESVSAWLDSVLAQTQPPDEIVLCDAGSSDGTIEQISERAACEPRIRLEVTPGVNVSEGRNIAIARASGPLIAVTDAGTILHPQWLERLVAPLEADEDLAVSAGFYRPAGRNWFERILATVITPRLPELPADGFPPSSRSVAFRKLWWNRVGGYPEWLRAGEDLVFDFRLRDAGARFVFAREAIVMWFPRPTLGEFFWQYRHYARGDGHGHLWPRRHAIRYTAYMAGGVLAVRSRSSPSASALLLAAFAAHMRRYLWRVRDERPFADPVKMAGAYALVPAIVITGDVAKMIGYPQGLWERWRAGRPEGLRDAPISSERKRSTGSHVIDPSAAGLAGGGSG